MPKKYLTKRRAKRNTKRNTRAVPKTRKLDLESFTVCHPNNKRRDKCLPDHIYSDISKKYNTNDIYKATGCKKGEDHCLLDNSQLDENVKKQLRMDYLRPRRPKAWDSDPDKWLDNYNIINVLKQYEKLYPWFYFVGVLPIDFSAPDPYNKGPPKCLHNEICELNLIDKHTKGIRGIGMIFNLDPHFKGGSHWVALYINLTDIKKPYIGYFDSYGYKTPALIARLMSSFTLQISTCELGFNARRFQYGGSECGMFSLYYIICMLHGISFKDFCKDSVNDAFMLQLRKRLFAK